MPIIDVILLLFLAAFVFWGFSSGLINMVGHILGLIIGFYLAGHYYLVAYGWIDWLFLGHDNVGKIVAFILVLTLVARIIGFIFVLIEKAFNILAIIPFLKSINRLAGALLGLIGGILILSFILYIIGKYAILDTLFAQDLIQSQLAPKIVALANYFTPLLPSALQIIHSII